MNVPVYAPPTLKKLWQDRVNETPDKNFLIENDKKYTYKEAWKNMWNELTEEERNIIMTELPNFDKDIFKEITGIEVNED